MTFTHVVAASHPSAATWWAHGLQAVAGSLLLLGGLMQALDSLSSFSDELRIVGFESITAYFQSLFTRRWWLQLVIPVFGVWVFMASVYSRLKKRLNTYTVAGNTADQNRQLQGRLEQTLRLGIEWALITTGGVCVVLASVLELLKDAGTLS